MLIEIENAATWRDDCMEFRARLGYRTVGNTKNNTLLLLEDVGPR
jgi:hypothetical protein